MKAKKKTGIFKSVGNWVSGFMTKLGDLGKDSSSRRMNQNDEQFYTAQEKISDERLSGKERRFWRKERDKAARRQELADRDNKSFIATCCVVVLTCLFFRGR